jgi:hypothetical protein
MILKKLGSLVLLVYAVTASSEVYKCKNKTGGYLYSDQKCVDESEQSVLKLEEQKVTTSPVPVNKQVTNTNSNSGGGLEKQLAEHKKRLDEHRQKLAENKKKMDLLAAENYS